jgi:hypothetical protein
MTGQDRTGQDRTGQDRTGQDGTGQDRTGQDTRPDRTGLDRTGPDQTRPDQMKRTNQLYYSPSLAASCGYSREEVFIDGVVRAPVIRVDSALAIVVRDDEIVVDQTIRRHRAGAAVAQGRDIGDTVPAVPRPVVFALTHLMSRDRCD